MLQVTEKDVSKFNDMVIKHCGGEPDIEYKKSIIWILWETKKKSRGYMIIPLKGFKDKKLWDKAKCKKLNELILSNCKIDSTIVEHDDNHNEYDEFITLFYSRIEGATIVKEGEKC